MIQMADTDSSTLLRAPLSSCRNEGHLSLRKYFTGTGIATTRHARRFVRFVSLHMSLRHLFVTEYLIKLKLACGAGTESFDSEKYRSSREAFGKTIMAWQSTNTIDIYDQSREGEAVFSVLAGYQQDLAHRCYTIHSPQANPLLRPNATLRPQPH